MVYTQAAKLKLMVSETDFHYGTQSFNHYPRVLFLFLVVNVTPLQKNYHIFYIAAHIYHKQQLIFTHTMQNFITSAS